VNAALVILLAVFAALALLALIVALLARRRRLPYRKQDCLLTPAERSFWAVLSRIVDGSYHVAWKVRIADVLSVPDGTRDRQRHLNRIFGKHLDFVLCDPQSTAPLLAIELDDSSHEESERRRRDAFVDAALRDAGLPLLRVPARRSYAAGEIAALIRERIGQTR
jgi:hypothetical protein